MKLFKRVALACVSCLALGVVGWIGFVVWDFERLPFPLSKLDQLHSRVTTNDVQRRLGLPTDVWLRTNDPGVVHHEWAYARRSSWPIIYIYFRPDGTFERYVLDR